MGPEIVAPVGAFTMVVLVVWVIMHYMFKRRAEAYHTMRVAVEKGQVLTPEAMEAMARMTSPLADLRKGIIFIAIALGFGSFAMIMGAEEQDVIYPVLGIGCFPLFIGLAFVGLHVFANENKQR